MFRYACLYVLVFLCGCQTAQFGVPPIEVTREQNKTLKTIVRDVENQARQQYRETGYVERMEVLSMLLSHDEEVRNVLEGDQLTTWERHHRPYFAAQITRDVMNPRRLGRDSAILNPAQKRTTFAEGLGGSSTPSGKD